MATEITQPRCDQCRFWEQEEPDSDTFGICHRYPPHPKFYGRDGGSDDSPDADNCDTTDDVGRFPIAQCDWWCGEFQPKPEVK